MNLLNMNRVCTGIHITREAVTAAQVSPGRRRFLKNARVMLARNVISPSCKKRSIAESDDFRASVVEALKSLPHKTSRVGVSLPDHIIRILVEEFDELPSKKEELRRFIHWNVEKKIGIPQQEASVAWQETGDNSGKKTFLIAAGFSDVIRDYEENMRRAGVEPVVIEPASITLFNLYCHMLPEDCLAGFIGVMENSMSLFVFERGMLFFHQTVKRNLMGGDLYHDIEMALDYYRQENGSREIRQLYLAGTGLDSEMETSDFFGFERPAVLNFRDILNYDEETEISILRKNWLGIEPAVGAALSLSRKVAR